MTLTRRRTACHLSMWTTSSSPTTASSQPNSKVVDRGNRSLALAVWIGLIWTTSEMKKRIMKIRVTMWPSTVTWGSTRAVGRERIASRATHLTPTDDSSRLLLTRRGGGDRPTLRTLKTISKCQIFEVDIQQEVGSSKTMKTTSLSSSMSHPGSELCHASVASIWSISSANASPFTDAFYWWCLSIQFWSLPLDLRWFRYCKLTEQRSTCR